MIVDTSAIVAIIRDEPEGPIFGRLLLAQVSVEMSTANYLESAIVIDAPRDPVASAKLDELMTILAIRQQPLTEVQAKIARQAYRDFGKGSGHRAQLNFGDCFAYALAKDHDEPLLFKGDDFRHTDVRIVHHPANESG